MTRGNSSFGRARPCQGRGGRFEPGFPLIVPTLSGFFFFIPHSGGGTGRHAGLKILFAAMQVWVQLPSRVQKSLEALAFRAFLISDILVVDLT